MGNRGGRQGGNILFHHLTPDNFVVWQPAYPIVQVVRKCSLMANQNAETHLEQDICIHIFTVSAAMVGVCLTVIGLLRVIITIRKFNTIADDILALDAVVFLVSCLLAYWALRTRATRRMHRIERLADSMFIFGLLLMVVVCGFITYAIEFS